MNYQVLPLFFMRITTLLFFFIAVGLSFIGVSALICYFILLGIFFPVAIAMRLHQLNESGLTLVLTENSQWTTYIYGFPAQEQRSILKNPCFFLQSGFVSFSSLGLAANSAFRSVVSLSWRAITPTGEMQSRRCLH